MAGYNGWTNYQTWNVNLWIQNDEGLYSIAQDAGDYQTFVHMMRDLGSMETPDGVAWNDSGINASELNENIAILLEDPYK